PVVDEFWRRARREDKTAISARRRNSRRLATDATRAWILFGDDRLCADVLVVPINGLGRVFCARGRAGRATGLVLERHAGEEQVIRVTFRLGSKSIKPDHLAHVRNREFHCPYVL